MEDHIKETDVPTLAGILKKENRLFRNWTEFYGALKIWDSEAVQWELGVNNRTMVAYDLFRNILQSWVSRKPTEATFTSLCRILRNLDYPTVANSVEELVKPKNPGSMAKTPVVQPVVAAASQISIESFVKGKLVALCNYTTVNKKLLDILFQEDIITPELTGTINHAPNPYEKASMLYHHFRTRPDSDLPKIVEALESSGNPRAVQLLQA